MRMNIRDLQYLVALSETNHFGQAAKLCHVSQPTLSTQIKKLEQELAVTLVERDNKRVILTEIGQTIIEHAKDVLTTVDSIKNIARQATDPESGTLTLGLIPTIGPYLLPYAVKAIKARFPELTLYLLEAKTEDLKSMLKTGKIDAAIMALPVDDERLSYTALYHEAFFAALPVNHPLAKKTSLTLDEITPNEIMLLEDGHCLRDQALDICQLRNSSDVNEFKATSLETLRQMVISGVGVTLLPTLSAESSMDQEQDIAIRPFKKPYPIRTVGLFYRSSTPKKTLLNTLGETIANKLPKGLKDYLTLAK